MNKRRIALSLLIALVMLGIGTNSVVLAQTSLDSNATINFEGGDLTLDSVPSLDFGTQTLTVSEEEYQLASGDATVALTDDRGMGVAQGWTLTAGLSEFTDGVSTTLTNAQISMLNGQPDTAIATATPSTANAEIALLAGGDTDIIAVADRSSDYTLGVGPNTLTWSPTDVELTIPALQASPGTHTAVITWNLSNAPS